RALRGREDEGQRRRVLAARPEGDEARRRAAAVSFRPGRRPAVVIGREDLDARRRRAHEVVHPPAGDSQRPAGPGRREPLLAESLLPELDAEDALGPLGLERLRLPRRLVEDDPERRAAEPHEPAAGVEVAPDERRLLALAVGVRGYHPAREDDDARMPVLR